MLFETEYDFAFGKPLTETYDAVKEKYDRRIKRQFWQIKNSKNVLVVYLQIPNDQAEIDDKMLLESHNILKDAFPEQNITLLYFYCNHGRKDVFSEGCYNGRRKIYQIYKDFFEPVFS